MASLTKYRTFMPDLQPDANFTDFVIDSDLIRDDPQLIFRKTLFESVNRINSVNNYNNYGVIIEVIETTNPKTQINRLLKQTTGENGTLFYEFLVLPIDKPSVSLTTYSLSKPIDLYKSSALLRCSSDDPVRIPVGTLVKLEYNNNSKDEASITKAYGTLPPVLEESSGITPEDVFKGPPCIDNSRIQTTADAVNGVQTPTNSSAAPTPNMATQDVCLKPLKEIGNLVPPEPDVLTKMKAWGKTNVKKIDDIGPTVIEIAARVLPQSRQSPEIVHALMSIINNEYDPNDAVGDSGLSGGPSIGPMQVYRTTAIAMNFVSPNIPRAVYASYGNDPLRKQQLLEWGVRVFRAKLQAANGNIEKAIMFYNGSGADAMAYQDRALTFIKSKWGTISNPKRL